MVRKGIGILLAVLAMAVALAAPAAASGKELSHKAAAAKLKAAGISWVSSGGCSNRNRPDCTSFSGIKSGTIAGVVTFKRASRCKVTVTGGTETGHAAGTYSHWNGYKIDIAITSCVTGYITRNYTAIGGGRWRASSGNVYFNEGDHWDITYY